MSSAFLMLFWSSHRSRTCSPRHRTGRRSRVLSVAFIGAFGRPIARCSYDDVSRRSRGHVHPRSGRPAGGRRGHRGPRMGAYVKTGVTRERPPTQQNWWHLRAAAVLRKVARRGPIGITALSQSFGGYKDNDPCPTRQRPVRDTSFAPRCSNSKQRLGRIGRAQAHRERGRRTDALQGPRHHRSRPENHGRSRPCCPSASPEAYPGLDKY